ncbi:AAA family ATPase [Limnohabitans sp.]|uniref:AAA family ATPase n=1 Tax=Limnohabitans sp. TaxID=1907725 RepID=UPI00286EFD85|nr:AAA family ATPase [Limnohabitans sp.]
MRIQRLSLHNFRGVASFSLDFTQRTTAFVGVNGVGKSTILDALAIALSQLTWRINNQPFKARPIALDDIRHGSDFARIEITVELRGAAVTWAIVTNRKRRVSADPLRKSDLDALNTAVRSLESEWDGVFAENQEGYNLPLAVYYDVNRAVLQVPMRVREKLAHNFREVYQDALDHGGADFKRFFIWFRNFEDAENEARTDSSAFRDRGLEAARVAISTFTGFEGVRVRRKPKMRMTVNKGGDEFNVLQLSDGERNMLALVGDMARRLSVLNPSLINPNDGAGIVLVDEIDLHLHPRWQREVVNKLEATFPNCQFIITTHSPQVIGELRPESVMLLRDGELAGHPQASYGLTSGQVLDEIMGASSRTPVVKMRLDSIFDNLECGNLAIARQLITEMTHDVPSVPELAGAEALLRRKEVLGR